MKIMHIVLTPRYSGAEILVRDISYEQIEMGNQVAIVSLKPSEESFHEEMERLNLAGVCVAVPTNTLGRLGKFLYIRKAIKNFRPDVIFAHSIIPAAYARLASIKLSHVISVLHSADNVNYNKFLERLSEKILGRLAVGVVAVSEEGAKNYRISFDAGRPIVVIKNGINFAGIHNCTSDLAAGGIEEVVGNKKVLLQVGRISRVKAQHLSISAAAMLLKLDSSLELWFAGLIEDEEYSKEIIILAQELGLASRVKFLGPRSDVFQLLAIAAVYLMPSFAEAHSVAMLEALASGVPIVCSSIPSFSEVAKYPGTDVINVENIDEYSAAIAKNLYSINRYQRDLSNFSIRRTAEEYVRFAEGCISAR